MALALESESLSQSMWTTQRPVLQGWLAEVGAVVGDGVEGVAGVVFF